MDLSGARQNTAALTHNASPVNIAAKKSPQPKDKRASDAPGIYGWPCGQSDWWHGVSISEFHTGHSRAYSHQNSGPSGQRRANRSPVPSIPNVSMVQTLPF